MASRTITQRVWLTGKMLYNSKWVQDSRARFLATTSLCFLFFSVFNYLNLYCFNTSLRPVDIVPYLQESINGPSDSVLDIAKDSFMRNRDFYEDNIQEVTIIYTPNIRLSKDHLRLELVEGFYNFTSSKVVQQGILVSTSLIQSLHYGVFNFDRSSMKEFIQNHLLRFYNNSHLDTLKEFDKFRFLIHISNFTIALSSVCICILLFIVLFLVKCTLQSITMGLLSFLLLVFYFTMLSFQFLDIVIILLMNQKYHNGNFGRNFIIVLGQTIVTVILSCRFFSFLYLFETKDDIVPIECYMKNSESSSESMKTPTISGDKSGNIQTPIFNENFSQTSSVYSETKDIEQELPVYAKHFSKSFSDLNNVLTSSKYTGSVAFPKIDNNNVTENLHRNYTAPLPLFSLSSDDQDKPVLEVSAQLERRPIPSPVSSTNYSTVIISKPENSPPNLFGTGASK